MTQFAGDIVEIIKIDETWDGKEYAKVKENSWSWDLRAFETIKVTKQELLDMPIGTKITTDRYYHNVFIKMDSDTFENGDDDILDECDINDDLSVDYYGDKIIKIEKPTYETFYEYSEEIKEMTMEEIEKELGYKVKIIKED